MGTEYGRHIPTLRLTVWLERQDQKNAWRKPPKGPLVEEEMKKIILYLCNIRLLNDEH